MILQDFKLISIIIPAKNEEENIKELRKRLDKVANDLAKYQFEFILIDNHSEDNTEELVETIVRSDDRWKYIRFSRNFGGEASLAAGLKYAHGDAVIILFSDIQDPPELIPEMIKIWEQGYDIIYGEIQQRKDHNIIKNIGAKLAHRLLPFLSNYLIPRNAADFQLLSRRVVNTINTLKEKNRYFRGLAHWPGFKKYPLPYTRNPRIHGKTKSKVLFAASYAVEGITSFSQFPLRLASTFGLIITSLSLLGMLLYTVLKFLGIWIQAPPVGTTTIIFLLFFFGGIQSFFLGIIGEYIGKIFIEVKDRPLWVIEKTIGFENNIEEI
jgi:polyisoprenyl-phosphate glycosyltransferase